MVWDHPRSRGEHIWQTIYEFFSNGSSPLTRGTLQSTVTLLPAVGIIPAHAGNTRYRNRLATYPQDHPRSRREHETCPKNSSVTLGSSPLTQGTRDLP